MTRRLAFALALVSALTGGCNRIQETPTAPTPIGSITSDWSSRLTVGGAVSRSFTTAEAGQISITLKGTAPQRTLGLGVGVPIGGGIANCVLTLSMNATGSSTPQVQTGAVSGTYCVTLFDNGTLTTPVDFDLSITFRGIVDTTQ